MNATELTLIRGWINGISYAAMDDAYLNDNQSSKQLVHHLLERLIQLGRLNGKSALSQILESKKHSEEWRTQALHATKVLSALPYRSALPDDPLMFWFEPKMALNLQNSGFNTIYDLFKLIENTEWAIKAKSLSPVTVKKVRHWFSGQPHLHCHLQQPIKAKRSMEKVFAIVPFNRLSIPLMLSKGNNANNYHLLQPEVDCDQQAANHWLSTIVNPKTEQLYRREVERFFLWSLHVKKKAVSSLQANDCLDYRAFLTEPLPRHDWVSSAPYSRDSDYWKPFVLSTDKIGLSPNSTLFAERVIGLFMAWLHKHQYLMINPYALLDPIKSVANQGFKKITAHTLLASTGFTIETPFIEVRRHLIERLIQHSFTVIDIAKLRVGDIDRERMCILDRPVDQDTFKLIAVHFEQRMLNWLTKDAPLIGKQRTGLNVFSTTRGIYKALKQV